jgi:hypothetical protein
MRTNEPHWDNSQITHATSSLKLPLETRLCFNGDHDPLPTWRQLSRYIAQRPHDLRSHAQRLILCQDEQLNDYILGALLDLHLVMGNLGLPFSQKLFDYVKPSLSVKDREHFSQYFTNDKEVETYNIWYKGSVLTNGTGKGSSLVSFTLSEKDKAAPVTNPLEEARSCLEYGELDTAQEILEQELLAFPDNHEVEEELINIYHYTRDIQQLEHMTTKLQEIGIEPSEFWKQCQASATNWN